MTLPNYLMTLQRVIREQEGREKSELSEISPPLNSLNSLNSHPTDSGNPFSRVMRKSERTCAQCHAGPSTDPPGDPPTLRIEDGAEEIWLHPECWRFWNKDSGNRAD